ncbi:hypothetical protein ACUM6F_12290, partial [Desulforudis sp. DRI-14]
YTRNENVYTDKKAWTFSTGPSARYSCKATPGSRVSDFLFQVAGNLSGFAPSTFPGWATLTQDEDDYFKRLARPAGNSGHLPENKAQVLERLTEAGLYPYTRFYLRGEFSTIGVVAGNEACLNLFDTGRPGRLFLRQIKGLGLVLKLTPLPGRCSQTHEPKLDTPAHEVAHSGEFGHPFRSFRTVSERGGAGMW